MNEILLEYYAGKSKELIKCEGYLADIVKDIKRDHQNVSPVRTRHVHRDSFAAHSLEETLAKFFNVKEVVIYWQSNRLNAATLTPSVVLIPDYKSKYMEGEKSSLKMYICVDENLVYKANLNESELLGVILHEIGHNFYYCPIMVASEVIFCVATLPLGAVHKLIAKGIYKIKWAIQDIVKHHIPFVYNLINIYNDCMIEFTQFVKPYYVALNSLRVLTGDFATRSPISFLPKYGGEKGADSFAAKYGYGPELASGLHKLSVPENMLATKLSDKLGPVGTVMTDLTTLGSDFVAAMMLNPHPNSNQRASSMLKKLENDLKEGEYPPELKKDLEAEIKRMRAAYEAINDPKRGGDPAIRKAWYGLVDELTKGHSDIREIFNFYYDSYRF